MDCFTNPLKSLCESLWDATMAFCLPIPQQDDFTLVCVNVIDLISKLDAEAQTSTLRIH